MQCRFVGSIDRGSGAYGPRSLLTRQASNRMWTQMALVYFMLRYAA